MEKVFDILMIVFTVVGLAMLFFGNTLMSIFLAAPAGAYCGNAIAKFWYNQYN